jgi:hypothetical protein
MAPMNWRTVLLGGLARWFHAAAAVLADRSEWLAARAHGGTEAGTAGQGDESPAWDVAAPNLDSTQVDGGLPAHWVERVWGSGPPLHWLERVRRDAPQLLLPDHEPLVVPHGDRGVAGHSGQALPEDEADRAASGGGPGLDQGTESPSLSAGFTGYASAQVDGGQVEQREPTRNGIWPTSAAEPSGSISVRGEPHTQTGARPLIQESASRLDGEPAARVVGQPVESPNQPAATQRRDVEPSGHLSMPDVQADRVRTGPGFSPSHQPEPVVLFALSDIIAAEQWPERDVTGQGPPQRDRTKLFVRGFYPVGPAAITLDRSAVQAEPARPRMPARPVRSVERAVKEPAHVDRSLWPALPEAASPLTIEAAHPAATAQAVQKGRSPWPLAVLLPEAETTESAKVSPQQTESFPSGSPRIPQVVVQSEPEVEQLPWPELPAHDLASDGDGELPGWRRQMREWERSQRLDREQRGILWSA